MRMATVLLAIAGDSNAEAAQHLRDLLTSWPAQVAFAALYVGLAALFKVVIWPVWLLIIELLWVFALWLYYFIRFMTRQRSGPGDPGAQRRGAALDGTISRMEQERRGAAAGGAADGPPAPR